MFEDCGGGEAEICSAIFRRYARMTRRIGTDVHFVEYGLIPRHLRPRAERPVCRRGDDRERNVSERVDSARVSERVVLVGQQSCRRPQPSRDLARCRVEKKLVRVESEPAARIPRPVRSDPVCRAGVDISDHTVPDPVGATAQFDAALTSIRVDQTDLEPVGLGGVDCKLNPTLGCCGSQWKG